MLKAFEDINDWGSVVRFSCGAHLLNRAVQQCFGSKEGAIFQVFGLFTYIICKILIKASCRRIVSHETFYQSND